MLDATSDDDAIASIIGQSVPSDTAPGVSYMPIAVLGAGAMSTVFYSVRRGPEGESAVVLKLMRPWFVRQWGPTASLIVKKEAVALGRLNERVPPTPFVVRYMDSGSLELAPRQGDPRGPLELPWVVLEYVNGGAEGTTLSERLQHQIATTGHAFDAARAANLVEALASGLMAVHEVGVIHRDMKADNVLCCGFGDSEIFKIADFGVARPVGVAATFGGMVVGTLGYAAPELATMDARAIGPWSDVFSLGSLLYQALTGEDYFHVSSPSDAILAALHAERRSIRESPKLAPEIRQNEQACRSIDYALGCATAGKIDNRPQRADALAAMLVPWLRTCEVPKARSHLVRLPTRVDVDDKTELRRWAWTTLRYPYAGRTVRSVSWDGDGRAMVATSHGLAFFNGATWSEASLVDYPNPQGIRFVRRIAPGRWLVGGDDATFATYAPEGITDLRQIPGVPLRVDALSGELDDLAVLVGTMPGTPPMLCALSGKRWLKPFPLAGVHTLHAIARVEDARWLVVGQGTDGRAFAGVYAPLNFECERIPAHETRAYLACAGAEDRALGVVVGAGGAVLVGASQSLVYERVAGTPELTAAAIDTTGRFWCAGGGSIFVRRAGDGGKAAQWDEVWTDRYAERRLDGYLTSLSVDVGSVLAMTSDGTVIEGRLMPGHGTDRIPPRKA
jgi:serine/threonine protein kinase